MAERGPLPKPYARRRNRRPGSDRFITNGRPPMPRDLPNEAKAEWRRIVPKLEEVGLLADVDRGVLVRYCVAWADWVELDRLLQQSGKLLKGARGNLVRNPLWFMKRDAEQTVGELGRQLGLTPMARLRAGIMHRQPVQEMESPTAATIEGRRARLLS